MNSIEVIVNKGLCIGCMTCITTCPLGTLETKGCDYGYPAPIKHVDCNECGICLLECPSAENDEDGAIRRKILMIE